MVDRAEVERSDGCQDPEEWRVGPMSRAEVVNWG